MKKSLIILLVLGVLLTLGLASCKNEVQAPADELVSVSFEQAVSRALTATLQEFKKENYYWYYAAKKADSTGLISGQTDGYDFANAVAVKKDGTKGLDAQVPGFSQGSWDFLLFAYEEDPEATGATITKADYTYWGEATAVTLKKNGANTVSVTVNPAEQGQGTLFVDMEHIKLSEASSASHNAVAPLVSISCGEKTYEIEAGSNIKYKVDAGQWTVKVEYTDGDIIFATGTVIATVYPRLTTIVTGDVSELITYAQFEAKENPDLVKVTAGSTATAYDAIPSDGVVLSGKDEGKTKTVSTTVAKGDAQKIMAEMATNAGVGLDSNTKMYLALNVDPTAATETSITYDISMSATLSVTQGSETKSTVKDVDKLDNVVIVEISMQKNLQNVAVTHSGVPMDSPEGASATNLHDGEYYYDGVNGKLYICTSSFSPFAISYKLLSYAASLNGVKYETLVEAFNAAVESGKKSTVYLLKDASGKGIFLAAGKADITVDLGGHTYTCTGPAVGSAGTQNQAWHLEKGNTVTIKSGKLTSTAAGESGVTKLVQNYCNLTLEDVNLDGTNLGSGKYTLSNNCGDVLITGSTSITAPDSGKALDAYDWRQYYPEGVSITIDTTGTIYGWIELDGDAVSVQPYRNSIVIKNGTFMNFAAVQTRVGKFSVEGGTFYNWNPTGVLAEGYVAIEIGDKVWKVVPAVAKIGSVYYATLQSALDAAADGDTVELLKDIEVTSKQTISNKEVVLDGHSFSLIYTGTYDDYQPVLHVTGSKSITIKDISISGNGGAVEFTLNGGDARCSINLINSTFEGRFKSLHFNGCKNADIVFTNSDTRGVYGYNVNGGSNLTWTATGTTFGGWNSASNVFNQDSFEFTGCEYIKAYGYSACKPYGSTTYNQCKFGYAYRDGKGGNGLATGVDTAISLNFNGCLVEKEDGTYEALNVEILQQMLNYEITSGSSSGPSTINNQYWYIDGVCVLEPTATEQED